MTVTDEMLLDAIETSLFLLPEMPGRVDWLSIPGLRGRITPASDLFANLVGAATLDAAHADETIRQVRDRFAAQNKEFGWIVGPRSTPADLAGRLEAAGLEKVIELAGMVHTHLDAPMRTNPAVQVREATAEDVDPASHLLAPALGITAEAARVVTEALLLGQGPLQTRVYLAFLEGVDGPVAYASTIYVPHQPVVVLFCAATLEEYRGKGVYTSLVARRLADAHRDGAQAAVIQAVRTTAFPICQKLGFVEMCGLDWYAWFPEEEEVELAVQQDQLVRSVRHPRQGWDEQFRMMAERGDDRLLDEPALNLIRWDAEEWEWS